jgi:hypothetical protein
MDRDSGNPDYENLAFLCLEHHELYDSTSRQAKGFTRDELKQAQVALIAEVERRFADPPPEAARPPRTARTAELTSATWLFATIDNPGFSGPQLICPELVEFLLARRPAEVFYLNLGPIELWQVDRHRVGTEVEWFVAFDGTEWDSCPLQVSVATRTACSGLFWGKFGHSLQGYFKMAGISGPQMGAMSCSLIPMEPELGV